MVRTSTAKTTAIKLLKPRDGDLKNVGPEPDWRTQPEADKRSSAVLHTPSIGITTISNAKTAKNSCWITWNATGAAQKPNASKVSATTNSST